MKNLTYIGWNEILQRYIVNEESPTGGTASQRGKANAQLHKIIKSDWRDGGVEEFRG